jgi:hypothetical protein
MPRADTSEENMTRPFPARKRSAAAVRCDCDLRLCISTMFSLPRGNAMRSNTVAKYDVARAVVKKTTVLCVGLLRAMCASVRASAGITESWGRTWESS